MRNPDWNGGDSLWTPQYKINYRTWAYGVHMNVRLQAEEIPAGAAIIYSMDSHEQMPQDTNGYVDRNDYATLTAGLNGGGGFSFYVEAEDINTDIQEEADTFSIHRSGEFRNSWISQDFPIYAPDPDPDDPGDYDPRIPEDNRAPLSNTGIAVNVNGLDPSQGWEILETATTFTRGGTSDTKLLTPTLDLYPNPPGFNSYPNTNSTRESSQPWVHLRGGHDTVPHNLHSEPVESGIFPSLPGMPPSFPGNGSPLRSDQHPSFPFWGLSWGLRLPDSSYEYNTSVQGAGSNLNAPIAWLAHYNPTASYQGRSAAEWKHYFGSTQAYDSVPTYIGGFSLDPSYFDLSNFSDDDKHFFIGHSDGVPGGFSAGDIPRAILFSIPDQVEELTSPAALAAAPLQSYGSPTLHDASGSVGSRLLHQRITGGNIGPTFPLSNSLLPPHVASDLAVQSYFPSGEGPSNSPVSIPYDVTEWGHNEPGRPKPYVTYRAQYDHSWILNDMLWDDFFFTPDSNSRLNWDSGLVDRGFNRSAQNVTVEGAFNVNSTSVNAWRSLLLGMLDVDIDNRSGEEEPNDDSERIPFARSVRPFGAAYSPETGDSYDSMSNFTGYRRLTLDEVDLLAQAIVTEVETRGPFLSVSDFVNRRLLSDASDADNHRLIGALQAAIETAGLNDSQENGSDDASIIESSDFSGTFEDESEFFIVNQDALGGASSKAAPGYFMQSDLLSRIGSVLQARSDTFVIRAYGDIGGPDNPTARAWCEIRVRRRADYVDQTDPAELHPDQTLPVNQFFGRRFEIIDFRWLSMEDV